ncbi:MAG: hypothetical protein CMM16_03920 [Rhodospirillaceae bacterium]|nr:hypothetical protein [Rhodospirillaceae bacterium]
MTESREADRLFLDLPAYSGPVVNCAPALADGLRATSAALLKGPKYMAVLDSETDVAELAPDLGVIATLHPRGVIATAPGHAVDLGSRFIGPSFSVPDDPVTGSAHLR